MTVAPTPQTELITLTQDLLTHAEKLKTILKRIFDLKVEYGWVALGFENAKAWWKAHIEGHWSYAHVMRMFSYFDACEQLDIESDQLNVLASTYLKQLPEHQRHTAYERAGGADHTDESVKLVVVTLLAENRVYESDSVSLKHTLITGQISAQNASALVSVLDGIKAPETRHFIELLIAEHGLQHAVLASAIAERHERETPESQSLVLDEIRTQHLLNQRPISTCTLEDWEDANRKAQKEHRVTNVTPLCYPFNTDLLIGNVDITAKTIYSIYSSDNRLEELERLTVRLAEMVKYGRDKSNQTAL